MIDRNMASKTVDYINISPLDTVVEIGAGLGALTFFLAQKGANIISFEIDRRLFKVLTGYTLRDSSVTFINKDIMKVKFSDFTINAGKIILIGSIPYAITTPIILKLLKESSFIKKAVFIVQKEVAQRLCASPGSKDYGVLSVCCQAYLKTSLHLTIAPECFYPKPAVDSAIIEMAPLQQRRWQDKGEALFRQLMRASFSKRRKTLYNCLRGFISQKNIDPELFKKKSSLEGIDLKRRAETLSVAEFYSLTSIAAELTASATSIRQKVP